MNKGNCLVFERFFDEKELGKEEEERWKEKKKKNERREREEERKRKKKKKKSFVELIWVFLIFDLKGCLVGWGLGGHN